MEEKRKEEDKWKTLGIFFGGGIFIGIYNYIQQLYSIMVNFYEILQNNLNKLLKVSLYYIVNRIENNNWYSKDYFFDKYTFCNNF